MREIFHTYMECEPRSPEKYQKRDKCLSECLITIKEKSHTSYDHETKSPKYICDTIILEVE